MPCQANYAKFNLLTNASASWKIKKLHNSQKVDINLPQVKGRKQAGLILIIIYAACYAGQPLTVGLIISGHGIPLETAGEFWASIATIYFLTGIFGIGSERFISVQIQRLKKYYLKSLRSNLIKVLTFFVIFFMSVGFIALIADIFAYLLFRYHSGFIHTRLAHPAELCLFCIFFFLSSNFMAAFLLTEGFQSVVMRIGAFSIILRVLAVVLIMHYQIRFGPNIANDYALVFTLCLTISAAEIIRIIGYGYYICRYLNMIIAYSDKTLDLQWKKDIWHYAVHSLQCDWVLIGNIIVEMFGRGVNDAAIFGYLFGAVRLFHLLGRIIQQLTRDSLVRSLFNIQTFIKTFWQVIILGTLITGIFLIIVLYFTSDITGYYKITEYVRQLNYLVLIGAARTLGEAFLLMAIFAYSKKFMRFYVYISSLIYFTYIIRMIKAAPFGISFAINTFIKFYFWATVFELVLGVLVLAVIIRRNQLNLLWIYSKTNPGN